MPKYILVSDFEKFKLYDIEENTEIEFTLKELSKKAYLFGFLAGYKKQEYKEEDEVNIKAAEMMGKLYDAMSEAGYMGHELNVLLVRILFCLFAEDAEIFNIHQFRKYIETRTNVDGSDLGMHLGMLFQVFNTPKEKRQATLDEELNSFEYVNGGLFAENISIPSFTSKMRERLLEACAFNWTSISPAIFGSLFQSVMDKDARRHLGAHYTSEKNILKLIKPLFLDELRKELDECGKNNQKLFLFQEKISKLKFLDPACGCGNFLIIAFRELRLLELEMLKRRFGSESRLGLYDLKQYIHVRPEQFYGIEIDDFPASIAQMAMWLIDHQMNEMAAKIFGENIPDLPLTKGANIFVGNALQKDWEEIVPKNELSYIFGNPPFIGSKIMTKEQRDDIILVFGKKYKGVGVLDYVSGWYMKATQYTYETIIKVAFVSTNSITQGEQVGILWGELLKKYGIKIHFAHKTFKWNNEARGKAGVYCVIIGFANFDVDKKHLYEYEDVKSEAHEMAVKNINPYLVPADDVVIYSKQKPICNAPEMSFGNMPLDGGNLLLSENDKNNLINQNSLIASYIKPLISAKEFLNNGKRFCLWLVDAKPEDLRNMPEVLQRIEQVKEFRLTSKRPGTVKSASTPSLFGEIRDFGEKFIVIPRVSSENRKYIPMGFFDKENIVSDTCMSIPNATLYHFGILESEMHMTWVRHVCGRLKSDFRYSKDIVYNNFPWSENTSEEKMNAVEKCAQEVLNVREKYPNSSLADLYDPLTMPADLVKAHQNLDRAVDSAYGKKTFNSSAERMNFLFELYEKYTSSLILNTVRRKILE
ncbi:MAG: N-6 DNA methylase [Candidatus Moranbacteria bacterium]|nr:N-6 DNA methylase [Candidatus Moranbacteria bacterium]